MASSGAMKTAGSGAEQAAFLKVLGTTDSASELLHNFATICVYIWSCVCCTVRLRRYLTCACIIYCRKTSGCKRFGLLDMFCNNTRIVLWNNLCLRTSLHLCLKDKIWLLPFICCPQIKLSFLQTPRIILVWNRFCISCCLWSQYRSHQHRCLHLCLRMMSQMPRKLHLQEENQQHLVGVGCTETGQSASLLG